MKLSETHLESTRELFRRHGIRCTRQRELIYLALVKCGTHPTADEIHRLVRDEDGDLSLATVYNTLERFLKHGLCRKVSSGATTGPCRFDAEVHDHAHAVLADGTILDLPVELWKRVINSVPEEVRKDVEAHAGGRVLRVEVQFVLSRGGGK